MLNPLDDISNPIRSDLDQVTEKMTEVLSHGHHSAIVDINTHMMRAPGKRVRSILALLINAALGGKDSENVVTLASSVECIHLASLVHDDILDEAKIRRKQASVYHKYGRDSAIMIGVHVYAQALKQISEIGNLDILDCVSQTVSDLCEGEFVQIYERFNFDLSIDEYYKIISQKTASLFSCTAYASALLASSDQLTCQSLSAFGHELGLIFQLTDDYLDIFGSFNSLNKTIGQDLMAGEITLPIILALQTTTTDTRDHLVKKLKSQDISVLDEIQTLLTELDIQTKMQSILRNHLKQAALQLNSLPDSDYRNRLHELLNLISKRCFGNAVLSST